MAKCDAGERDQMFFKGRTILCDFKGLIKNPRSYNFSGFTPKKSVGFGGKAPIRVNDKTPIGLNGAGGAPHNCKSAFE